MELKCNKCEQIKPQDQFYERKNRKRTHFSICKTCANFRTPEQKARRKVYLKKYYEELKTRPKEEIKELPCSCCEKLRPVEEFTKNTRSITGYNYTCKGCHNTEKLKHYHEVQKHDPNYKEQRRRLRQKNKAQDRVSILKSKLKAPNKDEIIEVLKKTVCDICGQPETNKNKSLSVDHCHKTGKIRGLLCSKHNSGLGLFQDSIETLTNAIEYLKRTSNE